MKEMEPNRRPAIIAILVEDLKTEQDFEDVKTGKTIICNTRAQFDLFKRIVGKEWLYDENEIQVKALIVGELRQELIDRGKASLN